MSIAQSITLTPGKVKHLAKPPNQYGRRIIRTFIKNGREYQLHATKGWRSYRVVK